MSRTRVERDRRREADAGGSRRLEPKVKTVAAVAAVGEKDGTETEDAVVSTSRGDGGRGGREGGRRARARERRLGPRRGGTARGIGAAKRER